jgi:hypothetical protein
MGLALLRLLLPVLLVAGATPALQWTPTTEASSIYYTEPGYASSNSVEAGYRGPSELPGGRILRGRRTLERAMSPYVLREDLFVEAEAELMIEPGVELRLAPMIGITVRGVILAEVRASPSSPLAASSGPLPAPGTH